MKPFILLLALGISLPLGASDPCLYTGNLQVGEVSLPLELRLTPSTADGAPAQATLTSPSQSPAPIPCQVLALAPDTVAVTMPLIGASFKGAISADGNRIHGTFAQSGFPFLLDLSRQP